MQIDNYADFSGHPEINFSYNLFPQMTVQLFQILERSGFLQKKGLESSVMLALWEEPNEDHSGGPPEDVDAHIGSRIGPL